MRPPRLVMAGGGTGGHVFPMIAVADALRSLRADLELTFVGTKKGLETRLIPERGYELRLVDILPLRGAGLEGLWRGGIRALQATLVERRFLAELKPTAVFSIGGYAAGPVAAAARSLNIPVAVMEPNSAIGLANRLMAPFVQRAYTAFGAAEVHFPKGRVLRTGVPIRSLFRPVPYQPGKPPTLLVLGGSQGARSLNELLPEAVSRLPFELKVIHQCGSAQAEQVAASYGSGSRKLQFEVVPFIEDMQAALASADLVVSRSGASALSEICAVGRASLLVPYPFAAGDHQRKNADWLAERGAALCLDANALSAEPVAALLSELLQDAPRLAKLAEAARAAGRPEAAQLIAEDLLMLAGLHHSMPGSLRVCGVAPGEVA